MEDNHKKHRRTNNRLILVLIKKFTFKNIFIVLSDFYKKCIIILYTVAIQNLKIWRLKTLHKFKYSV